MCTADSSFNVDPSSGIAVSIPSREEQFPKRTHSHPEDCARILYPAPSSYAILTPCNTKFLAQTLSNSITQSTSPSRYPSRGGNEQYPPKFAVACNDKFHHHAIPILQPPYPTQLLNQHHPNLNIPHKRTVIRQQSPGIKVRQCF